MHNQDQEGNKKVPMDCLKGMRVAVSAHALLDMFDM